jgi:ribonucleoside-diphosphate reductase alpha chain
MSTTNYVQKRDGRLEIVSMDKILRRIQRLTTDLKHVDVLPIAVKTCKGLYNGVLTSQLDELAAETAFAKSTYHPEYALLAGRIAVSNLQKKNKIYHNNWLKLLGDLRKYMHPKTNEMAPLITAELYDFAEKHHKEVQAAFKPERDMQIDYFGFQTLAKGYLLAMHDRPVETPQQMYMRVSLALHMPDLKSALRMYDCMSAGEYIHATPTLYNAGTPNGQLASCFLLTMKDDSIEGIYDTLKQCALISKGAGGIGLAIHNVRANGSFIRGTNGISNGIVPMIRNFNTTARYVDQGGGKRKGGFALYLEPWHADIFEFLDLRKNHGAEELRARDLFYGLWIPDLFMRRVESDGPWTLMCPNECPGLNAVWGAEFEKLYEKYEEQKKGRRQVKAREVWQAILDAQTETGVPYMLFKDSCNAKSNHQHLGTLQSSNLCTEILEYTSKDEVAVCNLASLALPAFLTPDGKAFDHGRLATRVRQVVVNLNQVIDRSSYPVPEAKTSNMKHRPIGLGTQGFHDVLLYMGIAIDSLEARQLNLEIFETMYFAALDASCDLAQKHGTYASYPNSPVSKGILQQDMWPPLEEKRLTVVHPTRHNWPLLRLRIAKHGLRNSLLMAPMPTASTSQILGNSEGNDMKQSHVEKRETGSGAFPGLTKPLVNHLEKLGLWNEQMRLLLIANKGSIQGIRGIPQKTKHLFRTAWEVPQKAILDLAADRGRFIDQSQSTNLCIRKPTTAILSSMHFYAWKLGLKTGLYYLRTILSENNSRHRCDSVHCGSTRSGEGTNASAAIGKTKGSSGGGRGGKESK